MTDLAALRYTEQHEWLAIQETSTGSVEVVIGITDYAAGKLGDVVFLDLPPVGTDVVADSVAGEIESTKSVAELYAPVTGTVVAINQAAVDQPELVNSDPFGDGWLIRIAASGLPKLLSRDEYLAQTTD